MSSAAIVGRRLTPEIIARGYFRGDIPMTFLTPEG